MYCISVPSVLFKVSRYCTGCALCIIQDVQCEFYSKIYLAVAACGSDKKAPTKGQSPLQRDGPSIANKDGLEQLGGKNSSPNHPARFSGHSQSLLNPVACFILVL